MKKLIKPIYLKKIKIKTKHKENQKDFQTIHRIVGRLHANKLENNMYQYMNYDNTFNETLQRSIKIFRDKSSTELSKDISNIRLGCRNTKKKHKHISLTKSENLEMSQLSEIKNKVITKEAKLDDEKKCQEDLKAMKSQLKEMKLSFNCITNTINDLSKKIEDNNTNYTIAKQIKNEINKMFYSSSSFFSKQNYANVANISKEILCKINQTKNDDIKEEIDLENFNYLNKIRQLKIDQIKHKESIKELRRTITKIQNYLLDHYHNILYQGIAFRQKGLSEIIRLIWSLDQEVNPGFFPTYLDQQSINFLYEIAKITSDLNKYQNKILARTEQESKIVKNNKDIFSTSQTRQNRLHNSNSDSTLLYCKSVNQDCYKIHQYREIMKKNQISIYPNIKDVMKEMSNEENKIAVYEKQIQSEKDKEIKRITKQFLYHNYGKKYNVCFETMISALFGKENRDKLIANYYITKKSLEKKIKECQFYYGFNELKKRKQLVYSTPISI